jgi:hypothetical protein
MLHITSLKQTKRIGIIIIIIIIIIHRYNSHVLIVVLVTEVNQKT